MSFIMKYSCLKTQNKPWQNPNTKAIMSLNQMTIKVIYMFS